MINRWDDINLKEHRPNTSILLPLMSDPNTHANCQHENGRIDIELMEMNRKD